MKTFVRMKNDDMVHKEWEEGEKGYIDGYCRGSNNVPFACVVLEKRIVMAPINILEVIDTTNN